MTPASVFVTESPNDRDLVKALGSFCLSIPVPHGDCCFWGVSEDESGTEIPIRILLERKKLGDMANSVIGGHYMAQLQAAHEAGFDRFCLVVETGDFRVGLEGMIEVPVYRSLMTPKSLKPRMRKAWQLLLPNIAYSRFDQYLTELSTLAGVLVKRSHDVRETAAIVKALWLYYQKPPSKHQSLHQFYDNATGSTVGLLRKPGIVRRMSKEISGIGWSRSEEVEKHFSTVRQMVNATVEEWRGVPGIGRGIAEKAVSELGGTI